MKGSKNIFRLSTIHFCILFIIFGVVVHIMNLSDMNQASASPHSPLTELNADEIQDMDHDELTFLLFYSDNSDASLVMEKNLSQLAMKDGHTARYYKINGCEEEVCLQHAITGFPTVVLCRHGEEVNRILGVSSYTNLKHIYTRLNK